SLLRPPSSGCVGAGVRCTNAARWTVHGDAGPKPWRNDDGSFCCRRAVRVLRLPDGVEWYGHGGHGDLAATDLLFGGPSSFVTVGEELGNSRLCIRDAGPCWTSGNRNTSDPLGYAARHLP